LLEPGPEILPATADALVDAFTRAAAAAHCAALSGSLPPGMRTDTYARSIAAAGRETVALDASGEALALGLSAAPLLVKPNRQEAAHLLGHPVETRNDAAEAAAAIAARGPRIVLLSLGADGAILHTGGRARAVLAPAVQARNTVGAGDCLLGGFLVGLAQGWGIEDCARYAVACGTAKVLHPDTGMLAASDVEDLRRAVRLVEIAPA
jgi:1-phosphofructokinase family hexose kinase